MLIPFLKHHVGREDLTGVTTPQGINIINLCNEEGNRIRLFLAEDVDTYGNIVQPSDYLIDEDDDYFDNPVHRDEHRADMCQAMNIHFHTNPYETRVVPLYGRLQFIIPTFEEVGEDSTQLRAVAINEAGNSVAVACNRLVYDTELKDVYIGDELILPPQQYRTMHVAGPTAWIEYERGTADVEHNATQYTYATDATLSTQNALLSGGVLEGTECMAMIARAIARHVDSDKIAQQHRAANQQREESVARLADARAAMAEYPNLVSGYNRDLRMNSPTLAALKRLTGCDRPQDVYPYIGQSAWNTWMDWVRSNMIAALNKESFYKHAVTCLHDRLRRAERLVPATTVAPQRTTTSPSVAEWIQRNTPDVSQVGLNVDDMMRMAQAQAEMIRPTGANPFAGNTPSF